MKDRKFQVGDRIRITGGPLAGQVGSVQRILDSRLTLYVVVPGETMRYLMIASTDAEHVAVSPDAMKPSGAS
jgi:hypothetical protein